MIRNFVQTRVLLTASTEFGVWDAVEVVVAESELEDPRLLQLDGHVGHGHAVADHGAVFSSWKISEDKLYTTVKIGS